MPRTRVTASAVAVTLVAETVIATLPGLTTQGGNTVDLIGEVDITTGAAATGFTLRIRRGVDTTGAVVTARGPVALGAGLRDIVTVSASDAVPADVGNQVYVLTAQQVSATGNGTANTATLRADF